MTRSFRAAQALFAVLLGVALANAQNVLVRTVDADGKPLGGVAVAVGVAEVSGFTGCVSSFDEVQRLETDVRTALAMIVDVRDLERRWLARGGTLPHYPTARWEIRVVAEPFDAGASVILDLASPPEQVRLSAADLMTLEVAAVNSSGQVDDRMHVAALSFPTRLTTVVRDAFELEVITALESAAWERDEAPIVDGVARFEHVASNREFVALVRRNDLSDWALAHFAPTDAKHVRRVNVRVTDALSTIVVRCTDLQGDAVRRSLRVRRSQALTWRYDGRASLFGALAWSQPLPVGVELPNEWSYEWFHVAWTPFIELRSDDVGDLRFEVARARLDAPALVDIERVEGSKVVERGVAHVAGVLTGSPLMASMTLSKRVFDIEGVVVDPLGAPVRGALVTLGREDSHIAAIDFEEDRAVVQFDAVVSDDNGAFRFHGAPAVGLHVHAGAQDYFGASITAVEPSKLPLRIELSPKASLRGYIRLADGASAEDLNLVLLRVEDGVEIEHAPGVTVGCSCDGLFEFSRLEGGRYTLLVRRAQSCAKPLLLQRIDDIQLGRGATDLGEIAIR